MVGRTNIVLDDDLVESGLRLSGLRTRRSLVHEALSAYVAWLRRRQVAELRGRVEFEPGYDHGALRSGRG